MEGIVEGIVLTLIAIMVIGLLATGAFAVLWCSYKAIRALMDID